MLMSSYSMESIVSWVSCIDCYFCVAGSVVSYVIPDKFRCCLCRQEIKQLGTEPMCWLTAVEGRSVQTWNPYGRPRVLSLLLSHASHFHSLFHPPFISILSVIHILFPLLISFLLYCPLSLPLTEWPFRTVSNYSLQLRKWLNAAYTVTTVVTHSVQA